MSTPSKPSSPGKAKVRPGLDFSVTGLIYCAMLMFIGLAAMNSQANLLFAVFGLMIGVLLVSGVISRLVLRGVEVRRVLPETAEVGRALEINYELTNRKRFWPSLSLMITELDAGGAGERFDRQPAAYILHAAGGTSASFDAEIVPRRRGWATLDRYQISTSFPFGFIKRAVNRRVPDRLLVLPAMGAVEPTAVLRFVSAESSGLNQRPKAGGYDELFGAREYRPGDPPRTIYWRRSARTLPLKSPDKPHGSLVVKQMTRVAPPRLMVMVDTYAALPAGATDAQRRARLAEVERTLATAASLIAVTTARGLSVGLVLWRGDEEVDGNGGWQEVRPTRGKRNRRDLLTALAEAGANTTHGPEVLLERGMPLAPGDTTALLITSGAVVATAPRRDVARGDGRFATDVQRYGRGNLVVIRTAGPELARWVRFDPKLDWAAMVGGATTPAPTRRPVWQRIVRRRGESAPAPAAA